MRIVYPAVSCVKGVPVLVGDELMMHYQEDMAPGSRKPVFPYLDLHRAAAANADHIAVVWRSDGIAVSMSPRQRLDPPDEVVSFLIGALLIKCDAVVARPAKFAYHKAI